MKMDITEFLRRRNERLNLDQASLFELADDLRTKRDTGEIAEEEWELWLAEIGKELNYVQQRTLKALLKKE